MKSTLKIQYRVCKVGTWKFNVIKTGCILLREEAERVEVVREMKRQREEKEQDRRRGGERRLENELQKEEERGMEKMLKKTRW